MNPQSPADKPAEQSATKEEATMHKTPDATAGKQSTEVKDTEEMADETADDLACNWLANCQPECCQCFARPSCLLIWLCLSSFTQGLVVNGFVNSVLTTLELRYDLSSSESGLIASMYDIGGLLFLVPVTYVGNRYRRSRLIAIGLLIMAVGSFVFSIPQFTTAAYSYQSPVSPLCYLSSVTYPDFCTHDSLNGYKFVFWLGQFLHGIGATPLYTLAVAYLDDNLTIQQSGAFLGAYYLMSLLGPAVGYLLGGIFLSIYVDPGVTPKDLSPSNTSLWVGAWWIGFLVSGTLSLIAVVPMYGFPVSFPGSARKRRERRKEAHGNSEALSTGIVLNAKDFLPSLGIILKNPVFVLLSLAGASQFVLATGLSTFGPKILQTLFYVSASSAPTIIGLVTVPAAAIGVLAGGLLLRFTNLSVQRLLWVSVIGAAADILFGLGLFAKCDLQSFAGVNRDYPLTPNQPNVLNASCHANCQCQESKFMYSPLCGADNIIYYSPCYAGCQDNGTLVGDTRYYAGCDCVSGQMTAGGANYSAVQGSCRDVGCNKLGILLTSLFFFIFGVFSVTIPSLQCTMRVIPAKLKDFGLGIQWVFFRFFGSIPGPLLLGVLVDNTCSLWTRGCGKQGSCSFYNGESFWLTVLVFVAVTKVLEVTFLLSAALLYAPPFEEKEAFAATVEKTTPAAVSNN